MHLKFLTPEPLNQSFKVAKQTLSFPPTGPWVGETLRKQHPDLREGLASQIAWAQNVWRKWLEGERREPSL